MNDQPNYRQLLTQQLDAADKYLRELKEKGKDLTNGTRTELDRYVLAFERNVAHIRTHLGELADARDETWEKSKAQLESAWESVRSAFGTDKTDPPREG